MKFEKSDFSVSFYDFEFVSETGHLKFESRTGQILHRFANDLPPLQHFFERSSVAQQAQWHDDNPNNSLQALPYYIKYWRIWFEFAFLITAAKALKCFS